jgi:hypothetical protein
MSAQRDVQGCFPGCYLHGCEATLCRVPYAEIAGISSVPAPTQARAEESSGWRPDGSYRTQFEADLLLRLDAAIAALRRRR